MNFIEGMYDVYESTDTFGSTSQIIHAILFSFSILLSILL